MAREYQKTVWQNEPNTATPIDADNLNHIENGIYNLETKVENKVDKVNGKGLSTNDFTDEKNSKLAGIETGAQANVQSDFSQNDSSADDYIKNKPNMANYATKTYVDNSFTIAGKKSDTTLGTNATAEGTNNTVTGSYGHGEGNGNTASGYAAHAENYETTASGFFSHSQGYGTIANGESQHVAGKFNVADNNNAYAEIIGGGSSDDSRANIRTLDWNGNAKYSGDVYAQNNKILAKAEDVYTKSEVDAKVSSAYHPAGTKTVAQLTSSLLVAANIGNVYNITDSGTTTEYFSEGSGKPIRAGDNVGICNFGTDSSPFILFDLLSGFIDTSEFATNSAVNTALSGKVDKIDGKGLSTNDYTTAEKEKLANINLTNYATKDYVDESYTIAGKAADTTVGSYSTAEGHNNTATGNHVHVEGYGNTATGAGNHAEGYGNTISGQYGHVEGTENTVSGHRTHVEGTGNIGSGYAQHVSGKYNVADSNSTYAEIVGGGEDSTHRANIRTLDWDGTGRYAGSLYVHDSRKVLDTNDKKEVASTFKDKYDESSIPSTYTTKYYSIGHPSAMYPAADYGSATTCCINVKNGYWYSYTDSPDDKWVLEDELPLRGGGTADNLTDLGDVNINSPLGGQVLAYNNSQQKWYNGNLPTVTITPTIQSGTKIADYSIDGTSGSLYAPQVSDINDLSDVDLNNLSNGQILKYNSTTQKWENSEESGSARPYFENYYPMSKVGEVNTLKFRYNNTFYIAKHVCYIDSQDKYMIIDRQGGIWITDVLDDVTYYSNISSNVTFEKFKWLTNDNVIGYATDGYIYYASAANALGGYFTQTTEIGTNLDFINFYEDDGVIYCITDTGVWESSDYGVTWTQIKTGTYTNSLSGDGMIAYTTSTKIYIKSGTDFVEYALPITSGNTVYGNGLFVCYTDGVIYTSTDSCNTWVRKYLFIDETGGTWYTVNALSDDLLITYTHGAFGICNDSQWALSYDFNVILSLSTYTDESSLDKWFDDGNNEYVYSTYGNSVYYAPYKTVKNIGIGKGLSSNDYTTAEKTKLAGIEAQANKTVVDSSMSTTSTNPLQNKVITAELAGTTTATGNPITIESSESNLVECVAEVEPIQEGSGDPSPTNIRPIIGQTEVVVADVGKNLWSYGDVSGTLYSDIQCDIKVGTYTLSALVTSSDTDKTKNAVVLNDSDGNTIQQFLLNRNSRDSATFTVDRDIKSISFYASEKWVDSRDDTFSFKDIQLEKGSIATDFEPYAGNTYTIAFGQTVYGGQLDVTKGELVVNTKHVKVSDLTWNTQVGNYGRFTALVSDGYYSGSEVTVISSCYKSYSNEGSTHKPTNVDGIYIGGGVGNVQIKIYDIAYPNATDLSAWENARADCDIVYKLATPYTIQLTPQQIRLLKGTNNISCNTGDLSIKYYPDNVLGQLKGDIESEYDDRIETLETQMVERPQLKRYSTRLLCDGFSSKNISITTDKKIIPLFARFDAEYMELYVDYEPRFYNPLVFYDDGTAYIEYQTSGIPNDNQQRTFEMYYYEV